MEINNIHQDEDYTQIQITNQSYQSNKPPINKNQNKNSSRLSYSSIEYKHLSFQNRNELNILLKENENLKKRLKQTKNDLKHKQSIVNNRRLVMNNKKITEKEGIDCNIQYEYGINNDKDYMKFLEEEIIDEFKRNDLSSILINIKNQKDSFAEEVDEVISRSYRHYYNSPCSLCSRLLYSGYSTCLCKSKRHIHMMNKKKK